MSQPRNITLTQDQLDGYTKILWEVALIERDYTPDNSKLRKIFYYAGKKINEEKILKMEKEFSDSEMEQILIVIANHLPILNPFTPDIIAPGAITQKPMRGVLYTRRLDNFENNDSDHAKLAKACIAYTTILQKFSDLLSHMKEKHSVLRSFFMNNLNEYVSDFQAIIIGDFFSNTNNSKYEDALPSKEKIKEIFDFLVKKITNQSNISPYFIKLTIDEQKFFLNFAFDQIAKKLRYHYIENDVYMRVVDQCKSYLDTWGDLLPQKMRVKSTHVVFSGSTGLIRSAIGSQSQDKLLTPAELHFYTKALWEAILMHRTFTPTQDVLRDTFREIGEMIQNKKIEKGEQPFTYSKLPRVYVTLANHLFVLNPPTLENLDQVTKGCITGKKFGYIKYQMMLSDINDTENEYVKLAKLCIACAEECDASLYRRGKQTFLTIPATSFSAPVATTAGTINTTTITTNATTTMTALRAAPPPPPPTTTTTTTSIIDAADKHDFLPEKSQSRSQEGDMAIELADVTSFGAADEVHSDEPTAYIRNGRFG